MGLSAGSRLGPYEILAPLGSGGMGEVYRARDTRLNRDVAIKILRSDITQDRDRLLREARSASALNHPNIVGLYDIGEADGADFLVMELVPGQSLERMIPRRGMRLPEALRIAIQIADALAAAHSAGIIHRDLKPSNVMVTEAGQVKLLDFGLAQAKALPAAVGSGATTGSTVDAGVAGTLSYMSPEQAEGKRLDGRSDIFSFGAVLYEMLTGEQAFHSDSPAATLTAILRDEPKQLAASTGEVPREVERVLARCLRKDPERRFQSAADLRVSLQELKEESDSGRLTATAVVAQRPKAKVPYAIAALVLLATVGTLWWKLRQPEPAMPADVVVHPLTAFPGVEEHPSLSPDGKQVAFTWKGDAQDNWDVYVMLTSGGGKPLRLTTSPEPDWDPTWSPDGQKIAFIRLGAPAKVMVMPALGGPERVVSTVKTEDELTWSANGQEILLRDSVPGAPDRSGIVAIDANTGERTKITEAPPGSIDRSPAVSPDGKMLAFLRRITTSSADVAVVSLDANGRAQGEPRLLKHFTSYVGSLCWAPDGGSVVFTAGTYSNSVITRLYLDGHAVTLPLGHNAVDPTIARQANVLVYSLKAFDSNVLAFEAGRDKGRSVVNSTALDLSAAYSPDGNKLAFMSTRSGSYEIWASDADGSNPVQLTNMGRHVGGPAWSPDGKTVAFDSVADGHWHIYTVPVQGGAARQLTRGETTDVRPAWSPDGQWLVFGSDRGGGKALSIWKVSVNGGEPVRVSQEGSEPYVTPDGRWLYYAKESSGAGVWRMPLAGGAEEKVLDKPKQSLWGLNSQGVYYLDAGQPRTSPVGSTGLGFGSAGVAPVVMFYSFKTQKITTFMTLPRDIAMYAGGGKSFAVSPDGKTILLTLVENEQGDLYVVDKFR